MAPDAARGLPRSYQNYDSMISEGDSIANDGGIERNNGSPPGNEYVLGFAFWSFVLFCTMQSVFAIIAKSQAMLADSQAMAVDALTYLFNLIAERWKNRAFQQQQDVESLAPEVVQYRQERLRLYLELFPPMISATILTMVTINSTREALSSLSGDDDDDEDVNVNLMLIFSLGNLVLDVFNVTCFARAHHAYGISNIEKQPMSYSVRASHVLMEKTELLDTWRDADVDESESQDDEPKSTFAVNLNMCSAWTHVMADTLRSTAVLVAATVAFLFESVDGSVADAVATLVVSGIILVSLLPLVHGLISTIRRITELRNSAPVLDV